MADIGAYELFTEPEIPPVLTEVGGQSRPCPCPTAKIDILSLLPPWYAEDKLFCRIVDTVARELDRFDAFSEQIRTQMLPQNADDTFGILGMWEALFGIPVEQPGVALADRQSLVLAHVRKRNSSAGSDWEAGVTAALNTNQWSYTEGPDDYTVTVLIPYSTEGFSAGQAYSLIREITPAHLDLVVGYLGGWLVGISLIGIDNL